MRKIAILLIAVLITMTFSLPGIAKGSNEDESIKGHWVAKLILTQEQAKIVTDVFGDKLYPNKAITRSEFAMYLHKALKIQIAYFKAPNIKDYFSDVKNDDKWASAVIDLVTTGIIDFKGKFEPDRIVSREEMAHYILKAYEYKTGEKVFDGCASVELFKDKDKMSKAYISDILKVQNLKLVSGKGNNKFFPKDKLTRAEAIAVVNNLLAIIKKQQEPIKVVPEYVQGKDGIAMKETITNVGTTDVTIIHPSGQKYDFILLDANRREIFRWSKDRMFTQANTETVLKPGAKVEFMEILKFPENKDILEKAAYLRTYVIETNKVTNPDGYEIKIKR